ncbi:MAG: hypothetical protein NTZ74_09400 [Chloroflexi bacterium]|nr:hypothetical protein [Chloroflexota bacterium]
MSDDYDGDIDSGDNGIDPPLNDTVFDVATAETSFDVDSVMDVGGDDFGQFEIPAQIESSDIVTEYEDDSIVEPVEKDFEQFEISDNVDLLTEDNTFDVNSIMEAGTDDFEQFETPEVPVESAITDELLIEDSAEDLQQVNDMESEVPVGDTTEFQQQTDSLVDMMTVTESFQSGESIEWKNDETEEIPQDSESFENVENPADTTSQNNQDGWSELQQEDELDVPINGLEETDTPTDNSAEFDSDSNLDAPMLLNPNETVENHYDSEVVESSQVALDQSISDNSPSEIQNDLGEIHQVTEPIDDNFVEQTNEPIEDQEQVSVADTMAQQNENDTPEEVLKPESVPDDLMLQKPDEIIETTTNVPEISGDILDEVGDAPVNPILETPDETGETAEENTEPIPGVTDVMEDKPIREYDDFEQSVLLKNPEFYESGHFYEQGINEYGYQGTCGPTSQANALNEVLGTNEFTENNILSVALANNLCETKGFPEVLGGTTTDQFMKLYEKLNEQTGGKIETELFEYNNALSLDAATAKLDDGAVLNVAVDSNSLWSPQTTYSNPAGGYNSDVISDHWITVTGAKRDDLGNVTGFDVIDSGGRVNYVNAKEYQEMCFGTPGHKVIDPTCIVLSKKDLISDVPEYPLDTSQVAKPNWLQRIFGQKGGN